MPALQPVPGVVKTNLQMGIGADLNVLNRLFIHYSGVAPADADLNAFCTGVSNAWGTHLAALVSSNDALKSVFAEDLTTATSAVGIYTASVAGTRTGAIVPASSSFVISKTIAHRYRGGHPRGYWRFGTGTDYSSEQSWSSSFVTAVQTAWLAFIAEVLGAGWTGAGTLTEVAVAYFKNFTNVPYGSPTKYRRVPTPLTPPEVDPVLGYSYRQSIGSQRRRNQFVG